MVLNAFEIPWSMWEHRNEVLHQPSHPWKNEDETQVNKDITSLMTDDSLALLPLDSRYVSMDLEAVLGLSLDQKREWVLSTRAAQARYFHHRERHRIWASSNFITSYFPRSVRQPPISNARPTTAPPSP